MAYGVEDEMLAILAKAFPKTFFHRDRCCIPLRVGIFEALDAALPPEIDRARLKLYLGIYTKQPRYLRELTTGAVRIGLDGRPAGRVSATEAASAAARLQKLHGEDSGRPLAKSARALAPASTPVIPPALEAVKLPRRLEFPGLAGAARRKNALQAKPQKVIVVLKKRKFSFGAAHHHSRFPVAG